MEFLIYNEIGDLNQARALGELYVKTFPSDTEMQIRLAVVHSRSNNIDDLDRFLETSVNLAHLSLRAYLDLAHLYYARAKPERTLDIITRRGEDITIIQKLTSNISGYTIKSTRN